MSRVPEFRVLFYEIPSFPPKRIPGYIRQFFKKEIVKADQKWKGAMGHIRGIKKVFNHCAITLKIFAPW